MRSSLSRRCSSLRDEGAATTHDPFHLTHLSARFCEHATPELPAIWSGQERTWSGWWKPANATSARTRKKSKNLPRSRRYRVADDRDQSVHVTGGNLAANLNHQNSERAQP